MVIFRVEVSSFFTQWRYSPCCRRIPTYPFLPSDLLLRIRAQLLFGTLADIPELAGPPPGYLPAGVKPEHVQSTNGGGGGVGGGGSVLSQSLGSGTYHAGAPSIHPSQYPTPTPTQYQQSNHPQQHQQQQQQQRPPMPSPTRRSSSTIYQRQPQSPGSVSASQALNQANGWGNVNDMPRTRYDGSESLPSFPRSSSKKRKLII